MDLSALSLQKLNKEKRERQPNWTESEKQLLLSLTHKHKTILENKGSDTMTIKRKSEAWDEIAIRMKAAGFNRSKERLKQQLGRIRAADAKRFKDAMEKSITEQLKSPNGSSNHSLIQENVKPISQHFNDNQIKHSSSYTGSVSMCFPLEEHQYIKSEASQFVDENNCPQQEIQINSRTNIKANVINYSNINACKYKKNGENSKMFDNAHFKLQNVQSLAETDHNGDIEALDDCYITDGKLICTADVTSTIPCSAVSSNIKPLEKCFESNQTLKSGNGENTTTSFSADSRQIQQQSKRRLRSWRSRRIRNSFTREQGLRQLYTYRVAVERERLRSLRLQQKRDRILYRKDIEIQNLKLQILRNLTNQNREPNSINF